LYVAAECLNETRQSTIDYPIECNYDVLQAQSFNETPQSLCDVDRTITKCNYGQLQADCLKYLYTCNQIKLNSIDISHYDELESTCVDCHEYGFNCNKFDNKLKFACFANNDFVSDVTAQGVYNDAYLNFLPYPRWVSIARQDAYVYIYSHDGSIFGSVCTGLSQVSIFNDFNNIIKHLNYICWPSCVDKIFCANFWPVCTDPPIVSVTSMTLPWLVCTSQPVAYFRAHYCVCTACLLHIMSLQGSFLACDSDIFNSHFPEFSSFVNSFNTNDIDIYGLYFAYSEISHLKYCLCSKNCATCNNLFSRYIAYIHATLGFLPSLSFPVHNNLVSNSITTIYSNLSSYLAVQHHYNGLPNFISKLAPVASHTNINLLDELSQGFHDTKILDLIHYGFSLDLDKSSFLPNLAVTNHGSALQFPAEVEP
jgi:hypothetical protein